MLNKYFPPDFDPSKIKRRKGINKDQQQVIRLMAPFSMRCNRCGEYVYKGKKFNARKETAVGEEYYGIKVFRFYIVCPLFLCPSVSLTEEKCPMCSAEITFKTDPKNADYICEHGATRNFENWSDATDKRLQALPDAAADDEYDSDGNPVESKVEQDAMADLEKAQEASRREMEMMDELADLRQRNARLELSNVNADPDALLATLHAERESAAEEARRKAEEDEDDALVRQYFSKISAAPGETTATTNGDRKGKGKAKESNPEVEEEPVQRDGDEDEEDGSGSESDTALPAALTIKRRPAIGTAEPTVASLLAAKGKTLNGTANGAALPGLGAAQPAQIKRKREGMQKLLGIKKKTKV